MVIENIFSNVISQIESCRLKSNVYLNIEIINYLLKFTLKLF